MTNPLAQVAHFIGDTLAQFTNRLDTGQQRPGGCVIMTDAEAEEAYRTDWAARKVVKIPADDATRAWRSWQAEEAQIEALEGEERRLQVAAHVRKGLRLARLYGGAVTVLGVATDNPSTPLDPEAVTKGALKWLLTLPRTKVTVGERDWTPGANYGLPLTYKLTPPGKSEIEIHHTRVIRWMGADVPDDTATDNQGWGDSVLVALSGALSTANTTTTAVTNLLQEAKIDVVKVKGLLDMVADPKKKELLLTRFGLAAVAKAMHGFLITDASEEWEQKQVSFAQLPEIWDRAMQFLAGAADIPATRLLSQSPAGMNSTGESDLRNYYDRVASEQENDTRPALSPLDECLIRSALGSRPPEVHYSWNPLWQLSEKEKAEIGKAKAETTKAIKETGLIPLVALATAERNRLVEDGQYPGIEQALSDADKEKELAPYEEPPPVDPALAGGTDPRTGKPVQTARQVPTRSPRQQLPLQRAANDAQTAPLYVSRPVTNAAAIIEWAREQGFKTTLPADQLHVTLAYSTRPVDWQLVPPLTDPMTVTVDNARDDGLPSYRWVTQLGDDGAVVLMFESAELRRRWQALVDAGAKWDHDHFWPHITLSYDAGAYLDAWQVNAYLGPIELGGERFGVLDVDSGGNEHPAPHEVSTERAV
jgi:phage-related protein (TIGR01555 family)